MISVIDLHTGPAVGFDEPFEMLEACHQRVERMLALLERLSAHLAEHDVDAQAQQAARDVMRYFDLAAPHHHADEERHVLPVLREHGHAALADRLAAEHGLMHAAWTGVRAALLEVVQGRWYAADDAAMAARWQDFAALYRGHIELEEREAYPAAAGQIDAVGLRAMGEEMARRRGVR